MAEKIPRRLRRRKTAGPEPGAFGGQKERKGLFSGLFGALKGRPKEKAGPKFYYEPGDAKGKEAGKRAKPAEKEEAVDKEELATALYEQLEMERGLRKETAKLALKEIKNFRRRYMRYPEEHEYEKIADSIYQQIKETYEKAAPAAGKPAAPAKRRRYTEKPEEKPKEAVPERMPAVSAAVPAAAPPAVEKPVPRERVMPAKLPAKPAEELVAETKGISIEGLFEGEAKEPLELSELAQPAEDLGLGELEKELKMLAADDIQTVTEEVETSRNKCPTCSTRAEDIIFCPHCGSGFCTHCALKAEVLGDRIKYMCPDCKKEVSVRKQAR